jgi:SAM-dependent methyltransferase
MTNASTIRDQYNQLGERADLRALKDFAYWGHISGKDWTELCRRSSDFARVQDGDHVFEAGCGSGAFLAELLAFRNVKVAGVDFAESLVAIAKKNLPGDFSVADITDLSSIGSEQFDKVLSHGVFLYLDTTAAAEKAASEMVRITKPGGLIYVGVVNDPDRVFEYEHPPSGSFALSRAFWRDFAARRKLSLRIVDQDLIFSKPTGYDAYSRIRYSLCLTKSET